MNALITLLLDWLRLARSSRARPFLLVTLLVDAAFIFVFLVALQKYLPEQHGGGPSLPGFALAAYGAAKLVSQLLGGRLIDRVGAGRGTLIGMGLIVLGQAALLAAAPLPLASLPAAALYGFGAAVLWPAIYALAISSFAESERARLTSAMTLTTGLALMTGLGLGLVLPSTFPYLAATVIALGAVAAAFLAAAPLRAVAGGRPAEAEHHQHAGIREIARSALHPGRVGYAAVVLLQSSAVGALLAIFAAYGRDVLQVSFRQELLLLVPAAIAGAGAVVIGGVLGDRVGRLPPLAAGFLATGAAIWLLSGVTGAPLVIALSVAGGVGYGIGLPSIGALSMDLSRAAGRGTLLAWFMTVEGLGHAAGPAAAGAWLKLGGDVEGVLRLVGSLFAGVTLVAALLLVLLDRHLGAGGERDEPPGRSRPLLAVAEDGS